MTAVRGFPVSFAVEVSSFEGEVVLKLHGELDSWAQPQFAAALAGIEASHACVVLDLADLDFVDAGSMGLIQQARKRARLRGTDLVLRSPSPHLSRILELTGLSPGVSSHAELNPIVLPLPSRAYERAGH